MTQQVKWLKPSGGTSPALISLMSTHWEQTQYWISDVYMTFSLMTGHLCDKPYHKYLMVDDLWIHVFWHREDELERWESFSDGVKSLGDSHRLQRWSKAMNLKTESHRGSSVSTIVSVTALSTIQLDSSCWLFFYYFNKFRNILRPRNYCTQCRLKDSQWLNTSSNNKVVFHSTCLL